MSRWFALPAFLAAALVSLGFWGLQGRPIPLPDAPSDKFPCVSYTPFRGGQNALDEKLVVPPSQIEEDLRLLSRHTRCVRTYSVRQGLAEVPRIAQKFGLKVILGAWIGRERDKNARELASAVDLANRYPDAVKVLVVGNEVLLRREMPAEELARLIRQAREATAVPLTYADVWEFWLKNPEVAKEVDVVTVHILPYWEDDPVAVNEAVEHVHDIWQRVSRTFPGKPVFIGETGWPSFGRMREAALPGRIHQARFVRETLAMAEREGIGINVIEAFDQPWKRALEGTIGGEWGLFSDDREPKFPLTGPVAPDPEWFAHFAAAAALSALFTTLALFSRRRPRPMTWLLWALASQAAASVLVVDMLHAIRASLTVVDWLIHLGRWGVAGAALLLVGKTLLDGCGRPVRAVDLMDAVQRRAPSWLRSINPQDHALHRPSAASLSREAGESRGEGLQAADTVATAGGPRSSMNTALGAIHTITLFGAAATTLAFLFDARYRDFPITAYAVPAAALLALGWFRLRHDPRRDLREERLMAVLLVLGNLLIAASERFVNLHALAWLAVALTLAAAVGVESWSRRRLRAKALSRA